MSDLNEESLSDIEASIRAVENTNRKLERLLAGNEQSLLITAAKHGKIATVKNLIARGVDVNSSDSERNLAVDYAWKNQFYDIVLLLLESDSCFPKEFNWSQLRLCDVQVEKNFKDFVTDRYLLHKYIEADNLENVKNILRKRRSKFHLSEKNESACYTALKCKKLNIEAYLKSVGAEFLNYREKKKLKRLETKDKIALREANIVHFPSVSDEGHIDYLLSKSRSQKPLEGLRKKLKNYYFKLDDIPEVSIIFKVIQYSDYLDIVFDFDKKNVKTMNPLSNKKTMGETVYNEGRLYIAAGPKRGERKILGTIAHELTHMAMQILFENECNPYIGTDRNGKENFERITKALFRNVVNDYPSNIIWNIPNDYSKNDYPSELIARVPQILAECENGREWLQENASELINFFTKIIIPKCHEFISASPAIKAKNKIRKFNESLGEIMKLKKLNLNFRTVDSVTDFLNREHKKIFVFKTEYTHLGVVKILQAIFGSNYINEYDKYLALNFENLTFELKEVMQAYYEGCDKLLLEFNRDPDADKSTQLFGMISEIFKIKPNKKIILIIHPNMEDNLRKLLQEYGFSDMYADKVDDEPLYLNSLDEKSRNTVLAKEIIFQGMKKRLQDFIGTNENFLDFISGKVIENLVKGEDNLIGSRTSEHHNLENASGYVYKKINMESFIRELKDSNDTFVISGLCKKDEFIAYFNKYIEGGLIDSDSIVRQIQIINSEYFKITDKKILLTERCTDADIKKFCLCNRDKKIYFIQIKKSSFLLKVLYNPNFYIQRKFKMFVADYKKLKELTSPKLEKKELKSSANAALRLRKKEYFIISKNDKTKAGKNCKKTKFDNVWSSDVKNAEQIFEDFIENETQARKHWFSDESDIEEVSVHWFHKQNSDKIHWINSLGSIEGLRSRFLNSKIKNELFISENDLTEKLKYKKVVLIADNPGMGKTTTLSKLYESSSIAKTHWVIRIDLKEHANEIKNIDGSNFNIKNLIAFLLKIKPDLDDKPTEDLLKSVLTTETGFAKCLLAFDGFDEILDQKCRENAICLLKYIQKSTKSKIWVTTRLHHKHQLENELSTLALEFDPIDDESKKVFIKNFFRDRLKLVLNPKHVREIFDGPDHESKISIYTSKFLEYMETIFQKDISTFIGTPLQLNLMTENSTDHFKTWAENANKNQVDFSYLGKNVLEVYEKFIEKKYKIYFRKLNIKEDHLKLREKELSRRYYKALAEYLTRNEYFDSKWHEATFLMLLIGLIQSDGATLNPQFIHFTFREYFFALVFTDLIKDNSSEEEEKKINYFIYEILGQKEHQLIRNFIDMQLERFDTKKLSETNKAMFAKGFNSYWRNQKQNRSPHLFLLRFKSEPIFWRTVKEKNQNIFSFIFDCCEELKTAPFYFDFLTMNRKNYIFLHKALVNKNFKIFYLLLEKIETLTLQQQQHIMNIRNDNHGTILHMGVESGDLNTVTILFEKLEKVLSSSELKSFLMEKASDGKDVLYKAKAKGYTEIVNLIIEKENTILPPEDNRRSLRRGPSSLQKYLRQSF